MNYLETLIEKYGISHQLSTKLLDLGRIRSVDKGSFVVFKEQTVDFLTFPLEGRFGLSSVCAERANSVFSIITPGTALNEVQLLLREDCLTDILATKNSVVLQLPFSAGEVLLKECIEFSNFLGVSLAKKQRVFHNLFQLRAMKSNTEKVYRAVKVIAEISDNNIAAINLISLGSLLYMSRNTVIKEINNLIEQGGLEEIEDGYLVSNLQGMKARKMDEI